MTLPAKQVVREALELGRRFASTANAKAQITEALSALDAWEAEVRNAAQEAWLTHPALLMIEQSERDALLNRLASAESKLYELALQTPQLNAGLSTHLK